MVGGIVVALAGAALWLYAERAKRADPSVEGSEVDVDQSGDDNVAAGRDLRDEGVNQSGTGVAFRGDRNTVNNYFGTRPSPPTPERGPGDEPDLHVRPTLGREPGWDLVTKAPTGQWSNFVWLNVQNRAHRSAGDARNVWAVINFANFEMSPARWRDSDDPYEVPDLGEITDRKTVRAGQTRQLDIAYRTEGHVIGYGLNTEAMHPQYGWRRPGWELDPGQHVVHIRLSADNAPTTYHRLVLDLPASGPFVIEDFQSSDKPFE